MISRYLFLFVILIGCQPNKNKLDLNFTIKGLKKGKVTLNKLNDTSFVKIDSFIVNGDKTINFKYHLEEPEILFLDLDVNDGSNARSLSFFAENKIIDITTSLENYGFDIIVKGSINDSLLREYKSINKKF